ncbi:hypothetical protein KOI35_11875 [Actinoplanes bogorensis]|uniref:Putative Flp pilus-assembly TadG-like N-terminal domain-containing protein n=1 Tax=Paractinoplanes bogorensis TaxID=1610840 RepID=A0ABS5YL66_9ACTN|nr:pilus assembly protein TadG-related protein [Actinoplanes bogorensis]MBU2664190.1 hypothetical protein [Actinoplanes bogorensis]
MSTRRVLRVMRRIRHRHASDHGVVAAMIAVLCATGMFFGMGAIVIDVNQIALERAELQSGADAASWAIAVHCIDDPTKCTVAGQTATATKYTNSNIKRGVADAQFCIYTTSCSGITWGSPITCPTTTITGGTSVEVRTSTRLANGSTLLPPSFAGTLSGMTYTGQKVGACGRVAWGPVTQSKVFAMGISLCDWKRMTNNGTAFYGPVTSLLGQLGLYSVLGLPSPTASIDSAIPTVLPASVLGLPLPNCGITQLTTPRGWVWLGNNDYSSPDANCEITLKVGDLPRSFLLSGLTQGLLCANRLQQILAARQPVLIPIFDQIEQTLLSVAPTYRIAGFAPFVFTGYTSLLSGLLTGVGSFLQTGGVPSLLQSTLCGASQCIYGYFTKSLVPVDTPVFGTGPDYGATIIARTG